MPEPGMSPDEKDERDVALRRYDTVLRFLVYEHTMFWTRSQFLLIANTALLGFVLGRVPIIGENPSGTRAASWVEIVAFLVSAVAGIALCDAWKKVTASGRGWIAHCTEDVLKKIEEKALGVDLILLRDFTPPGGRIPSATEAGLFVNRLFLSLWTVAFVYGWACVATKAICGAVFAVK